MNRLYLITFLIHLLVITNLRTTQIGHVNLYKVFKAHHDYSRYNFFLNRFVSNSDKKKIEALSSLQMPFFEPGLENLVKKSTKKEN